MLNMSPLELINRRQEESGNSDYLQMPYFKIGAGETKYLRFISAAVPTCVVSCSCGLTFDEPKSTVGSAKCPSCGRKVTDDEVIYVRPPVEFARMHKWVEYVTPDGKHSGHSSFVCLEDSDNVALGLVPTEDGVRPLYRCPVCSSAANLAKRDDGTVYSRRASLRGIAIAVERDVKVETTFDRVTGARGTVVTEASDVLDEDGKPRVVIVDMPKSTFWDFVCGGGDYSMSIGCLEWAVTKIGSGTTTKYSITPVGDYKSWDPRPYEPQVADIHKRLLSMASPERYCKLGYQVAGFSSQDANNEQLQAAGNGDGDAARAEIRNDEGRGDDGCVDGEQPPLYADDIFGEEIPF